MRNECEQCGTCCERGGPALHGEDLSLIRSGLLRIDDLVTIRAGEIVLLPDSDRPESTEVELIKIQGGAGQWCCRFLHPEERTCVIYEHRPLSCRLLQCWNPDEVLAVAGKKLLSRFDIIDDADPLLPLVKLYDRQLTLPDMIEVSVNLKSESKREDTLAELLRLVEKDLLFRTHAVERFLLPVARELFYFGRPLFHLLLPLGVRMRMTQGPDGIFLHYDEK